VTDRRPRPTSVWTLATALCLLAATVAADPPDWMAARAERLFQRVYAQPGAECPEGLDRVGDVSGVVCAGYDQGLERLRKTLKQFDDKPNKAISRSVDSGGGLPPSRHTGRIFTFHRTWRRQGNLHVRDWLEDEELVVIAYDEAAGRLAVLPKDSCLDPQVRARADLSFGGGEGFVEAEAIESPLPPPPPRSPNGQSKGGDAVVQFVVDRDGVVGDACVMHSRPGGFGKRALKAIERWVFVPATLDEAPVDSVVSIAFRWRQHTWEYERTAYPVRH